MSYKKIFKTLIGCGMSDMGATLSAEEISSREYIFGKKYKTCRLFSLDDIQSKSSKLNLSVDQKKPAIPLGKAIDGSIWALADYESVYLFSKDLKSYVCVFEHIEEFLLAIENDKLQIKSFINTSNEIFFKTAGTRFTDIKHGGLSFEEASYLSRFYYTQDSLKIPSGRLYTKEEIYKKNKNAKNPKLLILGESNEGKPIVCNTPWREYYVAKDESYEKEKPLTTNILNFLYGSKNEDVKNFKKWLLKNNVNQKNVEQIMENILIFGEEKYELNFYRIEDIVSRHEDPDEYDVASIYKYFIAFANTVGGDCVGIDTKTNKVVFVDHEDLGYFLDANPKRIRSIFKVEANGFQEFIDKLESDNRTSD